jgi:hypothetical protein
VVHVQGFAKTATDKIDLDGREHAELDIALSVGGTLRGFVFDAETGKPAVGATARLALVGGGSLDTRTDADGVYEFQHVLGRARVNLSRNDRCTERLEEAVVEEGETITLPTVYLKRGAAIVVRLKNVPEEKPSVRTYIGVSGGGTHRSTGTGGLLPEVWRLPNIPPGTYTVSFRLGAKTLKEPVTIEDGSDEVEVVFDYRDLAGKAP